MQVKGRHIIKICYDVHIHNEQFKYVGKKERLKFKGICLQQTFLRDSSERDGGKSEGDNKRFKEFGNNHFKVG